MAPFCGSYLPSDVTFLLDVIEMEPLPLEERERRIQSGEAHYSEMIGPEEPPSDEYLSIFRQSLPRNLPRLSKDFLNLAAQIRSESKGAPATLVSIARSGTPAGVILTRILRGLFGQQISHYCISVVRDKGADLKALNFILERRGQEPIFFIDGWTGKGVIAGELQKSVRKFNQANQSSLPEKLSVISDLAGIAERSAGTDDYLIPSCLLNSVVSGLISRTVVAASMDPGSSFHGCLYYPWLEKYDLSLWFADLVFGRAAEDSKLNPSLLKPAPVSLLSRQQARKASLAFLAYAKSRFKAFDPNLIKPGLGEATRVLLRRSPGLILVRDKGDPDLAHILHLAKERGAPLKRCPALPYRAAALIKSLK
ncbi:MAG: hypothetical protein LBE49_08965 [Deltaproteobacteria bacterium]|jgi:hypothetical protein|nr:hypothetical protein [Deltaproteobacteria bacterium]